VSGVDRRGDYVMCGGVLKATREEASKGEGTSPRHDLALTGAPERHEATRGRSHAMP
jgi:hypothetical protein